jgi:hypothetical protein
VSPRRLSCVFLLMALGVALSGLPAQAAPPAGPLVDWRFSPSSPFGGTRFDGEFVADQNRVYFLGFRTFGDVTDGSVWYLDGVPRTAGTWVDSGVDMPVPVSNYQVAALTDAAGQLGLYILGGRDATPQAVDTVQVYYPDSNTTDVIETDPWPGQTPSGCTTLPAMGVTVLDNKAYVLGGLGFSSLGCIDENSAQTWVFDPTAPAGSRWTAGPDLNVPRGYITSAVLGGTIYAIGGDTNSAGTLFPTATVEAWQPPAGGWDDAGVADLPVVCDESQAFGFDSGAYAGQIVLGGCGQWPNAVPDTHVYDSAADAWSYAGALNENRRNHAGALIVRGSSAVMYILGGYGEATQFIDPITTAEVAGGGPLVRLGKGGRAPGGRGSPGLAPTTS